MTVGRVFGQYELSLCHALGTGDISWSQLPKILEALRNSGESRSAFFLGGYFRALRERDSDLLERALDDLANDERLRNCVPELTWRSGPSNRVTAAGTTGQLGP